MPSVATAIDIARLYEELRDCVRANDQEGVKRVFAELVAARRPVAEILAEVKSLTKEREAAEAEKAEAEETAKNSFTREWPVATASAQIRPSPPAPAYRDFGAASEPPPASPQWGPAAVVEAPRAEEASSPPTQSLWRHPATAATPAVVEPPSSAPEMPRASEPPRSLQPPEVASPEAQAATAPQPLPEPVVPGAHEWPSHVAPVSEQESEAERQETARAVAIEAPTPASNPVIAAPPVTIPPVTTPLEPAHIAVEAHTAVEEAPAPSGPAPDDTSTPEASGVDLREIIRSVSGVTAEAAPQTQPISPVITHAAAPEAPAALDHNQAETAPMPRRAASLGITLDAPAAAVQSEPPARRIPVAAIAIAVIGVVALAGGGWFVLSPRAPEQAASTAAPTKDAALPAKDAAAPIIEKLRAAATPAQPVPGKAPAASTPAAPAAGGPPTPPPAPPGATTGTPQNIAVPDPTSTAKLDAAQGLAKPETTKDAASAPEPSAPAASSSGAKPVASEPRLSAAETEALLSRGDAAFSVGDVATARLFYERAADAGSGGAALRLGESYDPNFLERAKLRAIKGDSKAAAIWYRRAKELGVAEADILLKGIQTK